MKLERKVRMISATSGGTELEISASAVSGGPRLAGFIAADFGG